MDKYSSLIVDNKSIQFGIGNDETFKSYNVGTFSIEENKILMIIEDISAEKIAFENLIIQNAEKKKRASELVIANEELNFQTIEKENSATELVIMMKKAEESATFKSSFLANMSCEIRAPMNVIPGFSELLKNSKLSGERQIDYLLIIEKLGNSVLMELDFLTSLFNPNFIKFEEVIQQNIYSNLSVSELAKLCNMSLSSFKSKFAEVYKVSPIKWFLKIKLEKASELLKNKNDRIFHIAIEVGFESWSTFNRS
ncbi:MAG: AraC-like DNA-binding protein [Flavobacteriales bacterium]|jgi:AraC-like DNA-binding protein